MDNDGNYEPWELQEKIEILEAQVKKLEHILRFHNLDRIPSKYTKAFPADGEYPYFEAPGFKEFTPKVSNLSNFACEPIEAILPKDPNEFELAKQRICFSLCLSVCRRQSRNWLSRKAV